MVSTDANRPRSDPRVLERWRTPAGVDLLIRPVAADDAARELRFLQSLSSQARFERVFSHRGLLPGELRQMIRFDVRREIALLAAAQNPPDEEIVAVARLKKHADGSQYEFALIVGDRWQRQGTGARLLRRLLAVAKLAGVARISGVTLATNTPMKALCHRLGFTLGRDADDATVTLLSIEL